MVAAADRNMVANLSWADILGVLDELPMVRGICKVGHSCVYSNACPSKADGGLACEY